MSLRQLRPWEGGQWRSVPTEAGGIQDKEEGEKALKKEEEEGLEREEAFSRPSVRPCAAEEEEEDWACGLFCRYCMYCTDEERSRKRSE